MINKYFLNSATSFFFILCHLYNFSNKGYIVLLALFFIVSYKINKDVIFVLWHIFLTIFPFQRGRYFLSFVVEKEFWGGDYPINIEYYLKFTDFIILCLIALFIRLKLLNPENKSLDIKAPKELLFLFIFLAIASFSTFNATYTWFAFYQFFIFCLAVSLCFLSSFVETLKKHQIAVHTILIHTFIIVVLLCLQFRKGSQLGIELEQTSEQNPLGSFQIEAQNRYRPGGYFFDPNAAGTWILITVPFLVYKIINDERQVKKSSVSVLLLLFTLVGVVITGSRFIWIVSVLLFIFYCRQKKYRETAVKLFKNNRKLSSVLFTGILFLSPLLILRLANFSYTFSSGGGIDYRFSHYLLALQYIFNNPFGIGLGMFKYEILGNFPPALFAYDPTSPHNILIEVAVGTGILGLAFFSAFIYLNFKRQYDSWRIKKDDFSLAIFLSCICYITISQAYPYLLRSPLIEVFWIMIGFSFVNKNGSKEEKNA